MPRPSSPRPPDHTVDWSYMPCRRRVADIYDKSAEERASDHPPVRESHLAVDQARGNGDVRDEHHRLVGSHG
jgi:hypothetical protein